MCKKYQFKFDHQSIFFIDGKAVVIDVWKCQNTGELQIIDLEQSKIISLGGRLGKEAKL